MDGTATGKTFYQKVIYTVPIGLKQIIGISSLIVTPATILPRG